MLLKEIRLQNSIESMKNLGYCGGHVFQSPVQTRANFKATQRSQRCLGPCPVKCCKSPGSERLHPAWAPVPACDPLTETSFFPLFPCVGGKSLAVACDCYLWSCHCTSLRSLSSPWPTINLLLNFRKHSSFRGKGWRSHGSQDNNTFVFFA